MNINTLIIKEKLLELKKYNGTIVFSFGDLYIQFFKESNKRTIYCEVVSNNFLKSISKKQIQLIKNLNFKIDTENFYKNYKTNEIELILNETENIFSMIFQVNYNNSIEVNNMIEYPKLQTKNPDSNKSPLSKNPNPITIQERIISNYFIIGFSIIVVCIVIWMTSNQSSSSSDSYSNTSSVQKVMNSPWDSSVYQVEKYLIHNLNDPDSYEAIEWSKVMKISDDEYRVRHKYRAKNEYGGYVVENQIFVLDSEGNVINVWKPN